MGGSFARICGPECPPDIPWTIIIALLLWCVAVTVYCIITRERN